MEMITITRAEYDELCSLKALVASLQIEIQFLKNGKKSHLSSTPPSQDLGKTKKRSLRKKSKKSSGGQTGHEGSTLKFVENPNEIIEYKPNFCNTCGEEFIHGNPILEGAKQEIILPPIETKTVEHRSFSCICSKCGKITHSKLPEHLRAKVQYGKEITALIGYFSVRQYIPYNRIAEMMRDIFKIPLSQGTIDNMLHNLAEKVTPICETIRTKIEDAQVVGGDETGIKINGKKAWLFTFQNQNMTFLSASLNRSFSIIEQLFKNGFPKAVYVTDCFAAQLKTPAKAHQICTAHLMRELNNFIETFHCDWSKNMKIILMQAWELKEQLAEKEYGTPNITLQNIEQKLSDLLAESLNTKHQKIQAFAKRLNKNRNAILTFLYYFHVPPDNNASERAIRNAKIKTKISLQFKTFEGAMIFSKIRSVIDTTIKNCQNPLQGLIAAANC